MPEAFIQCFRRSLPADLVRIVEPFVAALEQAEHQQILSSPVVQQICGNLPANSSFKEHLAQQVDVLLKNAENDSRPMNEDHPVCKAHLLFLAASASVQAFLQSNVTGPPLNFSPAKILLPDAHRQGQSAIEAVKERLVLSLGCDGIAAYKLTPDVELFVFADAVLSNQHVARVVQIAPWLRLRVDFIHQRLLSEVSSALQETIYSSLLQIRALSEKSGWLQGVPDALPALLLEEATIHLHHGFDARARQALDEAVSLRGFEFALTGLLGKRTKYQQRDLSQLLVLAKSSPGKATRGHSAHTLDENENSTARGPPKPENLDLNDDTLLEKISFKENSTSVEAKPYDDLPRSLQELDPNGQPMLEPFDSIVLLAFASSIQNTSPADGLTREETLPYATRVLEGGSSNWQVYTQALLVRSRIEGYRSRTVERGLLQLQALVDQVVADTTKGDSSRSEKSEGASTFLPRAKESESASATERLLYIYQLNSPTRWEMEAELASRWVSLGGLRSALDIYERLEMWAEAALCWAATDREDKARAVVRRQLFHPTSGPVSSVDDDTEKWEGEERDPAPPDAPRLYCILGDIDHDPSLYEKAWTVSNNRYARAQRSLGRHYFSKGEYRKAAEAYNASIKVNQLNHSSWFVLGCCLLELEDFDKAAAAFLRTVQLDETDAEAWSNLATSLLKRGPATTTSSNTPAIRLDDEEEDEPGHSDASDLNQHKRDALVALKRAATLKHESHRIQENLLTVAASTVPPSYSDVVSAMRRIIDLRGPTDGERCIDVTILDYLVQHIIDISTTEDGRSGYDASKPGLQRIVVDMLDKQIVPLITASARLWKLVAKVALWRGKPSSALDAHEKAWRAVTAQPGWESGKEEDWNVVVDATIDLADAYESLGARERTEGLAAGSGELVMKDWQFKARSAVRGVLSKGRDVFEGTDGWDRLQGALEGLKRS